MNQGAQKKKGRVSGFSLMEVLVALALLAMSFVPLILVQARATKLAVDARNISTATTLARFQLMECKREAQERIASVGDFESHGDFADKGFPKFSWECHAPKFNMKTPSASSTESQLKKGLDEKGVKDTGNVGIQSDMVSPVMAVVTGALGDSVRELAVIVRWTEGKFNEEIRVVTHVINLSAMAGLARMISQGAQAFTGSSDKDKDKNKQPPAPDMAPQQGPPMQPPFGGPP